MGLLNQTELRGLVERLAAIERGSASPGERQAAEVVASELEAAGARARLEDEDAHGTYWWPVGLLTGAAAVAARSRLLGSVVGLAAALAVVDDVTGGRQWFRRRLLPTRTTTNVVGEIGEGELTVLFVAHHDAAHSGLVFHPELPRAILRRLPKKVLDRANTTPGTMWGAAGGPMAVAIGSLLGLDRLRRWGAFVSAGYAAAMTDIGLRRVVPGANDNLSGVAVLVSLARSLAAEPVPGVRAVLLSTGSEESFMEGMQAFSRRHFGELDPDRTRVVCLDTVGSPHLVALEGEGMIWMNEYPKDFIALLNECAEELGVYVYPGLRLRNATDGLIALRAGYRTLALASVDELKTPTNYHWPTDTPENVDYGTVEDTARVCRRLLERITASPLA